VSLKKVIMKWIVLITLFVVLLTAVSCQDPAVEAPATETSIVEVESREIRIRNCYPDMPFSFETWIDHNANGVRDEEDGPLEGVQVHMTYRPDPQWSDCEGIEEEGGTASGTTNKDGRLDITSPSDCFVSRTSTTFVPPPGYEMTTSADWRKLPSIVSPGFAPVK
jgi:hypothetical protein